MCKKSDVKLTFVVVLVFMTACSHAAPPSETKVYRRDYEYNSRTKAFYKLHIVAQIKSRVDTICELEGASLIAPTTAEDYQQIHGMMKKYSDIGDYVWVDRDGEEHEPAENPIIDFSANASKGYECDVINRKSEKSSYRCFAKLPFICKVEEKLAPYSQECGTYASNYIYNSTLGSCYSIPNISYSWNAAYMECEAQGAHLVVLNSPPEQQFVWDLIKRAPRLKDAQAWFFFNAGFRAYKGAPHPREFRTIFNQTLEEAGYNQWSDNEPNNAQDSEYCGTLFRNDGKFNDIDCSDPFAFVCEKEVKPGTQ